MKECRGSMAYGVFYHQSERRLPVALEFDVLEREEVDGRFTGFGLEVLNGQGVEDPDATAVGAGDEFALARMDDEVEGGT